MTVRLLESIKETERQADELIREARQKARQIIREAENEAAQLVKEGIAAAGNRSKEMLAKAEAEAKKEAAAQADAHQGEIEAIKSKAAARLPEAVAMIAGKVVKINAHS
ncbi:MAG: hypothetical protein GX996_00885 [Firmicutes bacterium]|nr:hypothetical protein [Bacillota bacterium]